MAQPERSALDLDTSLRDTERADATTYIRRNAPKDADTLLTMLGLA